MAEERRQDMPRLKMVHQGVGRVGGRVGAPHVRAQHTHRGCRTSTSSTRRSPKRSKRGAKRGADESEGAGKRTGAPGEGVGGTASREESRADERRALSLIWSTSRASNVDLNLGQNLRAATTWRRGTRMDGRVEEFGSQKRRYQVSWRSLGPLDLERACFI